MTSERLEVQRTIAADPATIFRVLCDPQGHVAIDSSGMLIDATGEPVTGVGDSFVVHMDREALNDYPMGRYDVTVTITTFVPDREMATSTATRWRPSTVAPSSPRTTTGRPSFRNGKRPASSRSCRRGHCGPPSGSSPERWRGAIPRRRTDSARSRRLSSARAAHHLGAHRFRVGIDDRGLVGLLVAAKKRAVNLDRKDGEPGHVRRDRALR